jgi:hypothetical protein
MCGVIIFTLIHYIDPVCGQRSPLSCWEIHFLAVKFYKGKLPEKSLNKMERLNILKCHCHHNRHHRLYSPLRVLSYGYRGQSVFWVELPTHRNS